MSQAPPTTARTHLLTRADCRASEYVSGTTQRGTTQRAALRADQPSNKKIICVCTEARARRTPDGIDILPVAEFLSRLRQGDYAS
jgi:hypothetical protein